MKTEIYLTAFQARRAAKSDFADILSIPRAKVHVDHDKFWEREYPATRCVCGETMAVYFYMSNATPEQDEIIATKVSRPGGSLMYGICDCCGDQF